MHSHLDADKVISCMHLSREEVLADPQYEVWMRSLPGRQVVMGSNEGHGGDYGYLSSARTLIRLNLLSPRFFPLPTGLEELPESAWQVLPGAARQLAAVMAVNAAAPDEPEAAAAAKEPVVAGLGLYEALNNALLPAADDCQAHPDRSGVTTAATTIGKLASLVGLPSAEANRSQISDMDEARIQEIGQGDTPLDVGATLVQMLSTHPGLSELLEQFRKHPAFQAPTDLSNHVSPAQIRACWPPWAPRTPPSLTPHAKRAATHLGKRPAPTPTPSPHPTGINESTAHPQQPPTQQALKSLTACKGPALTAPSTLTPPNYPAAVGALSQALASLGPMNPAQAVGFISEAVAPAPLQSSQGQLAGGLPAPQAVIHFPAVEYPVEDGYSSPCASGADSEPLPRAPDASHSVLQRQLQRQQAVNPAKPAPRRTSLLKAAQRPILHPPPQHAPPTGNPQQQAPRMRDMRPSMPPSGAHLFLQHVSAVGPHRMEGSGSPGSHFQANGLVHVNPLQHTRSSQQWGGAVHSMAASGLAPPAGTGQWVHSQANPLQPTHNSQHGGGAMRPVGARLHENLGGDLGPLPAGTQHMGPPDITRNGVHQPQAGGRPAGPTKPPGESNMSAAAKLRAGLLSPSRPNSAVPSSAPAKAGPHRLKRPPALQQPPATQATSSNGDPTLPAKKARVQAPSAASDLGADPKLNTEPHTVSPNPADGILAGGTPGQGSGAERSVGNPPEVQVVFMGTGSAEPQKYRGASAIHVKLESGWGVLLDAGEGTWGQFQRRYGPQDAVEQVASLACIWISHKHSDHLLGLPGLLSARPASCPPLLVVGPPAAKAWLQELGGPQVLRYRLLLNLEFNGQSPEVHWLFQTIGFWQFESVPVQHCQHAYAVVIGHGQGTRQWSLVYSGDCRPSERLVQAGQGCSLLIHEATFEGTLQADVSFYGALFPFLPIFALPSGFRQLSERQYEWQHKTAVRPTAANNCPGSGLTGSRGRAAACSSMKPPLRAPCRQM
ncbi:hypothetical protein WJX84_003438 [Apatococcus fuscideae]|uniref:ribonuclease Z n=1 Tax=Apatococcus fuscideae TaxID=2026836 RepID=A0AAW1SSB4_9CHLO